MDHPQLPAGPVQCVIFTVGKARHALPIDVVREILVPGPITPAPGAPHVVLGLVQVRGRAIPVVDLARCLGLPGSSSAADRRLIVVSSEEGPAALLVDSVDEVATVQPGDFEVVPVPGSGAMVVIKRADALIGWLSVSDVVPSLAVLEPAA